MYKIVELTKGKDGSKLPPTKVGGLAYKYALTKVRRKAKVLLKALLLKQSQVPSHPCILNISFTIGSSWFSIYFRIVSSVTLPTVAQKYPLDHKCCPQYLLFNSWYSSCISLDVLPFKYCTILLGDTLGGHDSNRCTCSFPILPCMMVIPLASHPCRINSLNLSAIFPPSTLYLYFVTHIIWYLISYTLWLPRLYGVVNSITPSCVSIDNFSKAKSVYRLKTVVLDHALK